MKGGRHRSLKYGFGEDVKGRGVVGVTGKKEQKIPTTVAVEVRNLTDGKAAAASSSTGMARSLAEKTVTQYRSDLDD